MDSPRIAMRLAASDAANFDTVAAAMNVDPKQPTATVTTVLRAALRIAAASVKQAAGDRLI